MLNFVRGFFEFCIRKQIFKTDHGGKQIILSLFIVVFLLADSKLTMYRHSLNGTIFSGSEVVEPFIMGTNVTHSSQKIQHTHQFRFPP